MINEHKQGTEDDGIYKDEHRIGGEHDSASIQAMDWADLWDGNPDLGGKLKIDPADLISWLIKHDQFDTPSGNKMLVISTNSWPSLIEGIFQATEGVRARFYDEFDTLAPFGFYVDFDAVKSLQIAYDKSISARDAARQAVAAFEEQTGLIVPEDATMEWFMKNGGEEFVEGLKQDLEGGIQ